MNDDNPTFWEHVDVLRGCLVRIIVVTVVCGLAAFNFKETLFSIVLAPSQYSFVSYRLLHASPFHINLVNIGLTEQFMIHVKTAFSFGFLVASPYVLYALYRFIAPALYRRERHYAVRVLGTYQVSSSVHNMLSLQSYIDTLLMMSLMFGILFEIPVISWLLALFGLLKAEWMQRYWRQALVAIVIVAAVITPTGDAFTLAIVSLPIWLLYEASILIVRAANR